MFALKKWTYALGRFVFNAWAELLSLATVLAVGFVFYVLVK